MWIDIASSEVLRLPLQRTDPSFDVAYLRDGVTRTLNEALTTFRPSGTMTTCGVLLPCFIRSSNVWSCTIRRPVGA
jgi:hypothetical protein